MKSTLQAVIPDRLLQIACGGLLLAAVCGRAADYSSTILSLNPAGYWPLNETIQPPDPVTVTATNSGTLGADLNATFGGDMVYGYPGALVGSTDPADSFSGFNATRAAAPYSSIVASPPSFTIEAWLLAHDDGTFWGTTSPLSDINAASPREGWLIYMDASNLGQYTFRTYAQNGTSASLSLDIGPPGSIQNDKWYHLAIVVSNAVTVTNVYAYLNGQLAAGPAVLPAYVPNTGANGSFTMGDRSDNSGYTWAGAMDEVAYYTNALSGSTVLAHYQTATNPALSSTYAALVQASHPALYYRMNEMSSSSAGPNPAGWPVAVNRGSFGTVANGYYQPYTSPGSSGPTNAGFGSPSLSCGLGLVTGQSSGNAGPAVLCAPNYQAPFSFNNSVSLAAWVRVPSLPSWFQTVVGRSDYSYRLSINTDGKPRFAANPNSDVVGSFSVADDTWHLWTGVFDGATKTSFLYIDGVLVAQGAGNPMADMDNFLLIGAAPDYGNRNFQGYAAHVAVFTNALSSGQILNLYNSVGAQPYVVLASTAFTMNEGANGTFAARASGTPALTYQWYAIDLAGDTNTLAGQTTAMLSLSNVQAAQNGYQYFVVVSNSYGTATSAIATLSVVQGPPTITYDLSPASQMAPVGATLSYQVQANGTLPFTYLWYRNGTLVSGATASTYSFTVTPGSNYFSCTITNTIGSANSAVVGLTGISVAPPVVNFANTGDWTINHNASMTTAGIVNGVLTLTDGGGSEVATAFYNTPQFVDGFVAFFTYQGTAGSSGMADGTTFCIQNSPAGAAAIGGGGGQMGIWGIGNSAAVILNIFQYANGGRGIQFGTNGMTVGTDPGTPPYISTAPVDMGSGHPLNVRVYALGGIWHVRLTDATTGATFLHSGAVGNTFPTIGSDNAYVGFTGATGGDNSSQLVSNFRFSSTTPPVLAVKRDASGVAISWPVSVASFFRLQQAPSLEGPWTAVDGTPTVANLQNIVTVQPTGTAAFYRLNLQ